LKKLGSSAYLTGLRFKDVRRDEKGDVREKGNVHAELA